MFHYVLFNVPFKIFHYFIFYSKIALWPISYMVKMCAVKMLVAVMSMAKMLTGKYLEPPISFTPYFLLCSYAHSTIRCNPGVFWSPLYHLQVSISSTKWP